ncbi:hypothetical protein HII31_12950 [Pseudocercospora fuligena]|uniref:GST N-terminal domain-containing protein n=1 Tax=Pseudocercospora fuligena TaxID=685502 RepID=A0A8H6R7A9_9PEZI|nr:hypothetical protein HII31_12950 [Pseudocercospora fuligena]
MIKTKLLLTAAGVPFERVDVPNVLPRPDLVSIGITYRRVPILAVGKDIYCDSKVIFDVVLSKLAKKHVPTSPADQAWEQWGFNAFADTLGLAPHSLMTPEFVKDRQTIYPLLARADFNTLRESALADLHSRMDYLENTVLAQNKYIGGDALSVADIQAIWGIRWDLHGADSQPPGLGAGHESAVDRKQFPKVWSLIDRLPIPQPKIISFDEAKAKIFEAGYLADVGGVWDLEPTGIEVGANVTVDALGSEPYRHPVAGKLVATSKDEIVIEVPTGLRLHFPRQGQILRRAI